MDRQIEVNKVPISSLGLNRRGWFQVKILSFLIPRACTVN